MSKIIQDVHQIAERFLRDIETGRVTFYAPEETETLVLADSHVARVVIARQEAPHYLAGIKPSGRVIFTHDMRLAVSYDANSLKLAEVLDRLYQYDMKVETMPACWFSNHQHG